MLGQPQATILFLRVSGDEAVKSAGDILARLVSGMIAGESTAPSDPTVEALPAPEAVVEPVQRITRQRKVRFQKPDDEPDGFSAPAPSPSTPSFVVDRKQKVKVAVGDKAARPPGALAFKILGILDRGSGVAPLEHLVRETGATIHGVNMAITKCSQLQRLDDGRIALTGYRGDD